MTNGRVSPGRPLCVVTCLCFASDLERRNAALEHELSEVKASLVYAQRRLNGTTQSGGMSPGARPQCVATKLGCNTTSLFCQPLSPYSSDSLLEGFGVYTVCKVAGHAHHRESRVSEQARQMASYLP